MKRIASHKELPKTALRYVLEGLIPYTEANIKLAFKPGLFFADLERIDRQKRYKKQTIRKTYYDARKLGLIDFDDNGVPTLTPEGKRILKPFRPTRLKHARLMVVFDIPENDRNKRSKLRLLLVELKFKQIQKSVWVSSYDSRDYLREQIIGQSLEDCVKIYESKELALN